MVIPIADRHKEYAQKVLAELKASHIRAEIDESAERMQAKIRHAQLQKIPYMLVVGDKEAEAGAVAIRLRSGEDLKAKPLAEFIALARAAIDQKE
jgi:threonyl-tRNA synthetase